jgi:lysophospholipase L1-like esterase
MTIVYDGTPLNATTTNATPGALATSTTGLWDTALIGTQGQWSDATGGVFSNTGTGLEFKGANIGLWPIGVALRPSSENALAQYVQTLFNGTVSTSATFAGVVLRYQSAGNYYLGLISGVGSTVTVYAIVAGAATQVLNTSFSFNAAHTYQLNVQVTGSSPTTITAVLTDVTTSTVVVNTTVTDSTSPLQSSGRSGIDVWGGNGFYQRIQTGTVGGALGAGNLSYTTSSPSGVALVETTISGGTAPYSTTLYRSTLSGFIPPGSGTAIGSPSSSVTPTFTDTTGTPGVLYFYKAYTTDAASGNATTNQVSVSQQQATINLGMIGDSLLDPTKGTSLGYNYWCGAATQLSLEGIFQTRQLILTDQALSNFDTGDWFSGGTPLATAMSAFAAAGTTIVLIQLGANDARNPSHTYSPPGERPLGAWNDGTTPGASGSYAKNMFGIVNALVTAGYQVMVSYCPFFIPNTVISGLTWNDASVNLANSYNTFIQSLANNVTMFGANAHLVTISKVSTWEYFGDNTGLFVDGVHPNQQGVQAYGAIHAINIASALGLVSSSGGAAAYS